MGADRFDVDVCSRNQIEIEIEIFADVHEARKLSQLLLHFFDSS
jgi:hypothetical protein